MAFVLQIEKSEQDRKEMLLALGRSAICLDSSSFYSEASCPNPLKKIIQIPIQCLKESCVCACACSMREQVHLSLHAWYTCGGQRTSWSLFSLSPLCGF